MSKDIEQAGREYMGIDVSDRHSYLYVLDEAGAGIEKSRIATTEEAFRRRFAGRARARVVIEAGTHSPWMSRLLEECGQEVLVANPHRVRAIYESNDKDDWVDAEALARLGRVDPKLLYPIQHRSKDAQADLAILRARDVLVSSRTKLVNHVRGAIKSMGRRLPNGSTHSFGRTASEHVPSELRAALQPVLDTITRLSETIREYDRRVETLAAQKYPETKSLRQVAGVGPLTAAAYVLILADPRRFRRSRSVGAYVGLRRRRDQSGETDKQLGITKAGSPLLRRLLVGSAHYILGPFGPDTDLRRWGRKLEGRGGKAAKKRAVIAVARKLAILLHRLWISGETYEPLRRARQQEQRPIAQAG